MHGARPEKTWAIERRLAAGTIAFAVGAAAASACVSKGDTYIKPQGGSGTSGTTDAAGGTAGGGADSGAAGDAGGGTGGASGSTAGSGGTGGTLPPLAGECGKDVKTLWSADTALSLEDKRGFAASFDPSASEYLLTWVGRGASAGNDVHVAVVDAAGAEGAPRAMGTTPSGFPPTWDSPDTDVAYNAIDGVHAVVWGWCENTCLGDMEFPKLVINWVDASSDPPAMDTPLPVATVAPGTVLERFRRIVHVATAQDRYHVQGYVTTSFNTFTRASAVAQDRFEGSSFDALRLVGSGLVAIGSEFVYFLGSSSVGPVEPRDTISLRGFASGLMGFPASPFGHTDIEVDEDVYPEVDLDTSARPVAGQRVATAVTTDGSALLLVRGGDGTSDPGLELVRIGTDGAVKSRTQLTTGAAVYPLAAHYEPSRMEVAVLATDLENALFLTVDPATRMVKQALSGLAKIGGADRGEIFWDGSQYRFFVDGVDGGGIVQLHTGVVECP